MARGSARESTAPDALPVVSFHKVDDPDTIQPKGVNDGTLRSYGFNEPGADWERPQHYIRHIEPLESELAIQVEYDMDEQDQEWLDALNVDRKKDHSDAIKYEFFEVVMDRLEKEYFDLTKNLPKSDYALPSEDSTCAICDDSEGENSNAIVFCDGCNLAVHQDCYGVPYIPEGQWLCRKCTVSPENPVSCLLCPNEGGAFKQTASGDWAHLLCAIWIPETRVANDVFMEPIVDINLISKQRWKLRCSVCNIREGACIQCSKSTCFTAFHVTCARKERLLLPMKNVQGSEPSTLTCYCDKHLPVEHQNARLKALEKQQDEEDQATSKQARAYSKTYQTGPPLVPAFIFKRIMAYVEKIKVKNKSQFVTKVCKYWSLKREARRGAPLLKRLHLEPWTAATSDVLQTESAKVMKLDQLRQLKGDLEQLLVLTSHLRKRERLKTLQAQVIESVVADVFASHESALRLALEKILSLDRDEFFKNPVSKKDVPDYFDIVKRPMSWSVIDAKLDKHKYWDIKDFKDDIYLVLDNAILYNKPDTPYHKLASRIKTKCGDILGALDRHSYIHCELSNEKLSQDILGDAEPPFKWLELLLDRDPIQADVPQTIMEDPLAHLFRFEFGTTDPLPPPPPPVEVPTPFFISVLTPQPSRRKSENNENAKCSPPGLQRVAAGSIPPSTDVIPMEAEPVQPYAAQAPAAPSMEVEPLTEFVFEQVETQVPSDLSNLPDQPLPPVVDDVGKREFFTNFETGWVLPEGQRRGGRKVVEKQPLPSRKRPRLEHGPSRLALSATDASENQTLQPAPAPVQMEPPEEEANYPLPSDTSYSLAPMPDVEFNQPGALPSRLVSEADGTVVVEELDTPATRRQRRFNQRGRPLPPTSALPTLRRISDDSDLSSLSESEGETHIHSKGMATDGQGQPVPGFRHESMVIDIAVPEDAQMDPSSAKAPRKRCADIIPLPDGRVEGGTLVWAKAPTFPWWPAVIYEEDDPDIPELVQKEKGRRSKPKKKNARLYPVKFFDASGGWDWVPLESLKLLGEDDEVDRDMLVSRKQRWVGNATKEQCRRSYQLALAEMEPPSDKEPSVGPDPAQPELAINEPMLLVTQNFSM